MTESTAINTHPNAYTSIRDFLGKASWEGGFAGGMLYGLRAGTDLTEEVRTANPEFVKLWDEAAEALEKINTFAWANFSDEMEEF